MNEWLLQSVTLVASAAIIIRAEPALNRMSPGTPILARLAFLLLAVGAAALGIFSLFGYVPSVAEVILLIGAALLLCLPRRIEVVCPKARRPTEGTKLAGRQSG